MANSVSFLSRLITYVLLSDLQATTINKRGLIHEEIIAEFLADDLCDVREDESDAIRNSLDRPKIVLPLPNHSKNELSTDNSDGDEIPDEGERGCYHMGENRQHTKY